MANSLNTDLEVGQPVLLKDGTIVRCGGGFGLASYTRGSALFVKDNMGNSRRVSGYDIVRLATEEEVPIPPIDFQI